MSIDLSSQESLEEVAAEYLLTERRLTTLQGMGRAMVRVEEEIVTVACQDAFLLKHEMESVFT